MNRRRIALLAFACASICAPVSPAADPPAPQSILIYSAMPAEDSAPAPELSSEHNQRLNRLLTGAFGKADAFSAQARVAFKTQKRSVLSQAATFELQPLAAGSQPKGWRSDARTHLWLEGAENRRRPLTIAMQAQKGAQPFRLGDYDEVWVDYAVVPGIASCLPALDLSLGSASQGPGAKPKLLARTAASPGLKILSFIDVSKAKWKEKDFLYLARRELGLAPDDQWRFARDGNRAVLQRRMHVPVNDVEAIDIALLSGGASVKHVNLRIGTGKSRRSGKVLEFHGLRGSAGLPDGRPGMRLNLREALERHFVTELAENARQPGKHPLYLQEITVFVPGEPDAGATSNPIRNIALLGADAELDDQRAGLQTTTLPSSVSDVSDTRQRLVVDLRELAQKGEFSLLGANLRVAPPATAKSCALRMEGVQAVTTYSSSIPAHAARVESWSRRWGGLFRVVEPRLEEIENPGIVAYLPLAVLSPGPADGPSLRIEGAKPEISQDDEVLLIDGASSAIEITWPVSARIGKDTRFFLNVPDGAEQIGSVTVWLDLADGVSLQRRIVANQPQQLVTTASNVKNIRLRIVPAAVPYRIRLSEIALFEPSPASFAQALAIKLPSNYVVVPTPVVQSSAASVLDTQAGVVLGLASREPVRFSTALEPALDWVRGVRLQYRLPAAYGEGDACALRLQLNWSKGKTERTACFEKTDGTLFIPAGNGLGGKSPQQPLGELLSIDWTLRPAARLERDAIEPFELSIAVEGWAMLSAADELRLSPILLTGNAPAFPAAGEIQRIAAGPYAPKFSLALDAGTLSRIVEQGHPIQSADHALVTLDEVVVQPRQEMSDERLRALTEVSAGEAARRWPRWLLLAGAALVLWLAWRWMSRGRLAPWTRDRRHALRRSSDATGRWMWRRHPALNLTVGAAALGPGLWRAGQLGWSFAGAMLLVCVALILWGVYCHWREARGPAEIASLRARIVALVAATGCAVWSIGRYGFSTEALWGFLPFLGASYALLPALGRSMQLHRDVLGRFVWLGVWLLVTVALYLMGMQARASGGENYFFTFGALAATLAWRAGFLLIEPNVRGRFPALAAHLYGGAGSLYFAGAFVMMIAAGLMFALRFEPIAQQMAIVVYYCLGIGVAMEAWTRRPRGKKADSAGAL